MRAGAQGPGQYRSGRGSGVRGQARPPTVYSFDVVALSKAPVQRVLIEEEE